MTGTLLVVSFAAVVGAVFAWGYFTCRAIDDFYNPRLTVVVTSAVTCTVNGRDARLVERRWHWAPCGRQLSIEWERVVEREVREWNARKFMERSR